MKNTNIKKVIAVGALVPLIGLASLSANANEQKLEEVKDTNITLEIENMSFAESKKVILDSLKEELKYTTDKKLKEQINKSFEVLEKITDENNFYETLDKEYEKLDSIYEVFVEENIEDLELNLLEEKKEILADLETELKTLVKDDSIKSKVNSNISELKNIKDEDKFIKKLEETYDILDSYYEKNGIEYFGEENMETYSFEEEKKEVLDFLKGSAKKSDLEKLSSITDENKFYEELDKIEYLDLEIEEK